MANPFEVDVGEFLVLRNDEGRFSLWPGFVEVPAGWSEVAGPDSRSACLAFVESESVNQAG